MSSCSQVPSKAALRCAPRHCVLLLGPQVRTAKKQCQTAYELSVVNSVEGNNAVQDMLEWQPDVLSATMHSALHAQKILVVSYGQYGKIPSLETELCQHIVDQEGKLVQKEHTCILSHTVCHTCGMCVEWAPAPNCANCNASACMPCPWQVWAPTSSCVNCSCCRSCSLQAPPGKVAAFRGGSSAFQACG